MGDEDLYVNVGRLLTRRAWCSADTGHKYFMKQFRFLQAASASCTPNATSAENNRGTNHKTEKLLAKHEFFAMLSLCDDETEVGFRF